MSGKQKVNFNSLFFILLLPLILFYPCIVNAADVTIGWDRPDDGRVAGYNVYYGQSGTNYKSTPKITINSAGQTTCTISGLTAGAIYGFTITNVDEQGLQSAFAEECYYNVPLPRADTDGDGLTNDEESGTYGTDPNRADTDADGINDYKEVLYWGNDWQSDIDGDGIINLLDADSDNDGVNDGTEIAAGKDPANPADNAAALAFEAGEVVINHDWTFVDLTKSFVNPVVVAGPMSYAGNQPAVIRIRNVSSIGFEIRIQEWEYLDGAHAYETVGYMVMEAGAHTLTDGTRVQAGKFQTAGSGTVLFPQTFNQTPVVFSAVVTFNGGEAVTGRCNKAGTSGFDYVLQEQEANRDGHATETISYIAWEPSSGYVDGHFYEVSATPNAVLDAFYRIYFDRRFSVDPVFISDMQTIKGWDTANLRFQNKNTAGIDVMVTEEKSNDSETRHAKEVVGYIVIE